MKRADLSVHGSQGARRERGEIFTAVVDRASHKIVYTVCRTTLDESTLSMRPREEGNW